MKINFKIFNMAFNALFKLMMLGMVLCLSGKVLAQDDDETEETKAYRHKMEACLTLVRKIYGNEEAEVQVFIKEHPTRTKGELANKILARMMMKCRAEISQPQTDLLLSYKNEPLRVNPDKNNLAELVAIDLDDLTFKGDPESPEANAPMYQTQEE